MAPDEPDDLADLSDDENADDGGADDVKGRNRRTQVHNFNSYLLIRILRWKHFSTNSYIIHN